VDRDPVIEATKVVLDFAVEAFLETEDSLAGSWRRASRSGKP
jgi:hypothetical protein